MTNELIIAQLTEAAQVLDAFVRDAKNISNIDQAANMMVAAINNGGKIISCGNGGSHCDAMHFAEELTGRYRNDRQPLPAIAISDTSHITCVGNDFGFDQIFSRYVEALGSSNDVLLGISSSGNSENIIKAAQVAKKKGIKVVALTGKNGGKMADLADIEIRVPHQGYADRIQEIHIKIIHIIILLIEQKLVK